MQRDFWLWRCLEVTAGQTEHGEPGHKSRLSGRPWLSLACGQCHNPA